jgi:hypothetical protein
MRPHLRASRRPFHALSVGLLLGALALVAPGALGRQNVASVEPIGRCDPRVPIRALPFTIDECGSYVVTRCLKGVPGSAGITVAADDVTVDLAGFSLEGVPGSLEGIVVQAGRRNVAVVGGTVQGWGGNGIDAEDATDCLLEGVRARSNGGYGAVLGFGGVVRDCMAPDNAGSGFVVGPGGIVSGSAANSNGVNGIVATFVATATGVVIEGCSARGNAFVGVFAGDGTTVAHTSVTQNGTGGISVGAGCNVVDCTVIYNGEDGINAFDSLVRGNTSRGNAGAQINAPSSTLIENHETPSSAGLAPARVPSERRE